VGQGLLVSLESGDAACGVTLQRAGGSVTESASFEICELGQGWIGDSVRFSKSETDVLAAECAGDVDCGRSDRILLIDRMQREPASAECGAGETVAFRCAVGAKEVAVCHSAGDGAAWLQYRFGAPAREPELIVPEFPTDPANAAEGRVEAYAGGGASWLRFRRGDHAYVVYSGIGRWGPDGTTLERAGVAVERRGVTIADLPCTGPLMSALGPEWFERLGVAAPDSAEFMIPDP
jgi:hypothetical protein